MNEKEILAAALHAVSVFDREHVEDGHWEVVGPVQRYTVNMDTGSKSAPSDVGYGIQAVEPKKFGGTVIVASGLSKAFAERAVAEHEEAIKPLYLRQQAAPEPPAKEPKKRKKPRRGLAGE